MVRLGHAGLLDATGDQRGILARQAGRFEVPQLLQFIRAFNQAAADQRGGWQPQLPLELAFVECALAEPILAAGGLAIPAQERLQTHAAPAEGRPDAAAPARPGPTARPAGSPSASAAAAAPPAAGTDSSPNLEPAAGLTLADVKMKWPQVKAAARKQHASVHSLINSCQPIRVEGDVIVLGTQAA